MRLTFSSDAKADLRDIVRFSRRRWGTERARRYVGGLRNKLVLLIEHPELGPAAEEVRPGLRRYSYISHVAYYRIFPREVRIIRILHQHMRVEDHIG